MDDPSMPDWERFGRLLGGEATESEEIAHWERLEGDPAYADRWASAQTTWAALGESLPGRWNAAAARQRVGVSVSRARTPAHPSFAIMPGASRARRLGRVALAATAAAAAFWLARTTGHDTSDPGTFAARHPESPAADAGGARSQATGKSSTSSVVLTNDSIAAPPGRTRRVVLADGSRVVLTPGSVLLLRHSAGERWGSRTRQVALRGDASFSVQRDTLRPFVVTTAHAEIRVLGTEFVASSRLATRGGPVVGVAVRHGLVGVRHLPVTDSSASAAHVLRRGDAIAMSPTGAMTTIRAEDLLALPDGRMVFDRTPIADVMREISRWYGVTATIARDVDPALRVTTTIEQGTLHDVIDQLEFTTGLHITRTARTLRVTPPLP